ELIVKGQQKGLPHIVVKLPMRSDVHNGKLTLLELCFQTRKLELLVEQKHAGIEPMHRSELLGHVRQRRKVLHRVGKADGQRPHCLTLYGTRTCEGETRS